MKEIKGDLLDLYDQGNFDAIAHGANCFGIMGAGIAGQIKERYPEAYYADKFSEMGPITKFSTFTFTHIEKKGVIFNLYTQYNPGPNAEITAIRICMKKVNLICKKFKIHRIGLPLIGCGIGGLNWEDVKPIIQEELKNFDVTIVHYEKTGNNDTI